MSGASCLAFIYPMFFQRASITQRICVALFPQIGYIFFTTYKFELSPG